MMKFAIINGPNLNLLGTREKSIYGDRTFEDYFKELKAKYQTLDLHYFQSNSEGALIDEIHRVGFNYDGIVINAGAFTHTSLALADAIAAITTPVVEVHISNIFAREPIRHHSMISAKCVGIISGFGLDSYRLAIEYLVSK